MKKFLLLFCVLIFAFCIFAAKANAATLSFGPSSGMFIIDTTFDVSVFLDTQGEEVNTIEVYLKFPTDKLQLVFPSVGQSIIDIWFTPPKFNNQTGVVELRGGIPGGVNVTKGLVTKLTFRARGVGLAPLKFLEDSRVLLNDGLGTDALRRTESAVYETMLPPPAGPIVASSTHPEQSKWYSNPSVILSWVSDYTVEGCSYVLDKEFVTRPDNISEGLKDTIIYKNLSDGRHYFHIKVLRSGVWGGVTHFAINIDTTPPAEFPIKIIPDGRTTRRQPVIEFSTTDELSGLAYYELKLVPLKNPPGSQLTDENGQPFFIEVISPYVFPELAIGTYDVIVQVHDKAGNYREVTERLRIVNALFQFVSDKGLVIKNFFVISWFWFWLIAIVLLGALGYLAWFLRKWYGRTVFKTLTQELPAEVKEKLDKLKKYRQRYGKLVILLFLAVSLFFLGSHALASDLSLSLNPPLITTVSRNISNEEIFYVGGKTDVAQSQVILYIQNLQTGETFNWNVVSNKKGEWFYRHDTFLSSGNYLLWAQQKVGDAFSPPSPQIQMTVRQTAIQFGASRLSYETLYLISILVLIVILIGLLAYIIFRAYAGRKKHRQFWKEVKEAEESVRRGFAVLKRDIQAELAVIKKAKLGKELSKEGKEKETVLLKDLEEVENYIGKEIWDIEKTEHSE
jgi:hypothetical protein